MPLKIVMVVGYTINLRAVPNDLIRRERMECKECGGNGITNWNKCRCGAASGSDSPEFALLCANKLYMATTLTTVVLERLEKNKNTPEWLRGSVDAIRSLLTDIKP